MQNIIISNLEDFERKKQIFKEQGKNRIHVISDFDRTLTKAFVNEKKMSSIISYLRKEKGKYLTEDYAKKAQELFDNYHPIEIDNKLSINEKKPIMQKWWKEHFELLINSGLDKKTIKQSVKDMINENSLVLREKVREFFHILNKNKIPLIIISSSVGDIIKEFLNEEELLLDNVNIIANSLEFKDDKVVEIKKIVHVFNKDETSVKELPVYEELKDKKNVILLGDSLGDLGMIEGFEYDNLIKIGFLNHEESENLEEYKKNFDVVILKDSGFDYINETIKEIVDK